MRKCKLKKYKTEHCSYKGEPFMRAVLNFEIVVLWFFNYEKSIIYDVTMFEDFKNYMDYWNQLILNKNEVPFKIIKSREIF